MKSQRHRPGRYLATLLAAASLGIAAPVSLAEEQAAPAAVAAATDVFPQEQLEQLVAPIALYPDALIAQILMASTYPLDVVQANRWLGDHEGIEGDALQTAVDQEQWDDSVKALVFFPSVLGFMSDNLDWTQDLGDAVLAQEGELTDTIQRLRGEADKVGALSTNEQQRVEKAGDTIIIQPAQPEVVYVPSYDPVKVYGDTSPPPKQYYPDAYADSGASYDAGYAAGRAAGESATSYVPGGTVVPAESVYPSTTTAVSGSSDNTSEWVSFGVGALAGGLLTAAIMWDDDDDWNDRIYYGGPGYYGAPSYWSQPSYWNNNGWRQPSNVYVDRTRNIDIDRTIQRGDATINKGIVGNEIKKWEHNPERRGGVRYRDASTENKFAARRQERTIDRDAARGRIKAGDRDLKAPDLGAVRREGAASGGLSKLAEDRGGGKIGERRERGDAGGRVADLKDRGGDRQLKAPALDQVRREGAASGKLGDLKGQAGAGGKGADLRDRASAAGGARPQVQAKAQARAPDARAKAQARAPAAKAKAKPRVQSAATTKRPVNKSAKRPSTSQVKRPTKAASRPQAQRPAAKRASAPKSSAFKASKSSTARAASNRGGASRAKAAKSGGGAARGGGGRRRG
jgi:hypothetical protein